MSRQPTTIQPSDVRISALSALSDDVFQAQTSPPASPSSPGNPYVNKKSPKFPSDTDMFVTAELPRSPGAGPGSINSGYSNGSKTHVSRPGESRPHIGSSALSDFLGSSRSLHDTSHVQDGCVILGKDGDHKYVTRYRINTQRQRAHLGRELLNEECCPVCEDENRETCCSAVFSFISGESFLLSLHISALMLGVAKEAFEVGEISADLEIIHSSVETFVAVIQLVIRIFATRANRKAIRKVVTEAQHVTGEHSVTGHQLQRIINAFTILATILIIFAVICLVAFTLGDHLTWTILSNNFAMIVGTVSSNLILLRIQKIQAAIRMDQHKAVLYESTLLLQNSVKANTPARQEAYYKHVKLFLKALMGTELFTQPNHIELDERYKDKYDLMTNLEMMSYV